ncbi:type IV toxin-antitoxin system AbiEi family antitoxin domain-containing protein [Demequina sp. NBRC 110053]|uniref:type IV toxin-antitoxin system AbiEi family antitoxin domain-containing protein n=1 Tax=Demequina sp. NBRC 110053 TaxID=1570342 RepID=UPI0013565885|nr:type IV toxin-antitoxin system AbiEi family antitoxin domain-containing protein [Demequina sp. NBRC 110053]
MDVRQVIEHAGGVCRTSDLLREGASERAIATAVVNGSIRRVSRGLYAVHDADPALVIAASLGGALACVSALSRHGVLLLHPRRAPHVAVVNGFSRSTRARRRAASVAQIHYCSALPPMRGPAHVQDVATALDLAGRCLDRREHLVAVDSALHQGLVRPDQVAGFTLTSRERRSWLMAHADPRAESIGETLARLDVVERGLAVHPQRYIRQVGRVDMVVEDSVVVEVDGRAHHTDPEAFIRDRRRDRRLESSGLPVLRYAHRELVEPGAPHVGDAVISLLRSRGT